MKDYRKKLLLHTIRDTLLTDEVVHLHNEYCDVTNQPEHLIFKMDDFDEIFSDYTPSEIARAVNGREPFSTHDVYFTFYSYPGCHSMVASFNIYIDGLPWIDAKALAAYMDEHNECFGNRKIRKLLVAEAGRQSDARRAKR